MLKNLSVLHTKAKIEKWLLTIREEYFHAVLGLIKCTPFVTVEVGGQEDASHAGPVFKQNGLTYAVPTVGGIYLVYLRKDHHLFYCDDARNLRTRLSRDFTDASGTSRSTALKKRFERHFKIPATLDNMAKHLKLQFLPLSFGRGDVEQYLTETFKLNSRRKHQD